MGTRISLIYFVNKCYFVIFNKSTTQYHDTTLSKQIIFLHHVSISAERPQINTRRYDNFLKTTKLLKANTIKALRHAHTTYYINYDVSTVEQKYAPV